MNGLIFTSANNKCCACLKRTKMQLFSPLLLYRLAFRDLGDMICAGSLNSLTRVPGIILSFGTNPSQTASSSIKIILNNKRSSNAVCATVVKIQRLYYRHKEKTFDHSELNLQEGGGEKKTLGCSVVVDGDWRAGGSKLFRN